MIDKLLKVGYYLMIALVVILGALLVGVQSQFIEGYELRIVQSGSMEPAISTGSLVITREAERYQVGDIITFNQSGPDSLPTTHRIIGDGLQAGEVVYTTQGDANPDPDLEPVSPGDILGQVIIDIPWLGYIIDFARQPLGFILIIGIPALLIAIDEISTIVGEIRRKRQSTKKPDEKN
jgi:signal peptidase